MTTTRIAAGTWLHNPVTGELARLDLAPDQTGGRRLETTLWLQPGAAVAGPHVHDRIVERFEVVEGEVGFVRAAEQRTMRPGGGPLEIVAGVAHDWWNAGDGVAQVRVDVEALPDVAGRPAARFAELIEAIWSLGALGRVNAKGMPDLLWLAVLAREYRDVIRFTSPPAVLQAVVFPGLAALARRTGRDPLAAFLHGPEAPCAIEAPDDARFAELVETRVRPR